MQFEDELEPELDQYDETLSGEDYETWPGDANTTFGEKKKRRQSKAQSERKKWEPHEDAQLLRLIKKCGTKNWRALASHMKGRLPKQCRERWINHLDPNITKGKLTDGEWQIVLNCHRDLGNRWSEIAKFIPGRTPNQIKNHWHAKVRKGGKRAKGIGESGSASGEESSASGEEDRGRAPPPLKKRKTVQAVVYESPSSSPNPEKKTKIPNNSTIYRGTWTEFEALIDMVEIVYAQEIISQKMPEVPTLPNLPSARPNSLPYTIPPLAIPLGPNALPNYEFGLSPFPPLSLIPPPYPANTHGWPSILRPYYLVA